MKKIYIIILLILLLIVLSTYNHREFNFNLEKKIKFFTIKNLEVKNTSLIEKSEVKEKLKEIYNMNIFFITKKNIEEPLKDIKFLDKIEVEKKYPDKIIIKIFETEPIAKLIKNKKEYLLDSSSNLILLDDYTAFEKFPSIFGEGAENAFIKFFNKLKKENFLVENIMNYYYFQIGRWDVQMINNQLIKFPDNNIENAIKKSIKLLNREDFKNYNIIDLRVAGKVIVE